MRSEGFVPFLNLWHSFFLSTPSAASPAPQGLAAVYLQTCRELGITPNTALVELVCTFIFMYMYHSALNSFPKLSHQNVLTFTPTILVIAAFWRFVKYLRQFRV